MRKKGFHFSMEEVNGEQSYSYNFFLETASEKKAWAFARAYAARFYGEDDNGNPAGKLAEGYDDTWEFDFGAIVVSIEFVLPCTRREFTRYMLNRYTIKLPKGESTRC